MDMRIFKNTKTGKIMELDESREPNLIKDLENDDEFKELIKI